MKKLQDEFPNFMSAMEFIKGDTDLRLVLSNDIKIKYIMTFMMYNSKLGDISGELNKLPDGNFVFTFSTFEGLSEKARTSSDTISYDLPVEEWIVLINDKMVDHNYSEGHQQILLDFSNKMKSKNNSNKSGCMPIIFLFLLIIVSFY